MRFSSQVKPISYLKANAAAVLAEVRESGSPVVITQNGKATAVLQDIASFDEAQETLALLKLLSLGNQELVEGKIRPLREVVARIRRRSTTSR